MESIATQLNKTKKIALHRRLYNWVLHWAETPYALPALAIISFVESSFFPIPPDVLIIAMAVATPTRWARIAFVATLASVLGGVFGYAIGAYLWQTVGLWIITNIIHLDMVEVGGRMDIRLPAYMTNNFGKELGGEYLFQVYDMWNAAIVFVFGLTPLPYKLVTITAGVARVDMGVFILASIASRALRFFAVAWILKWLGPPAKELIEKNFNLFTILFTALLIGGFAVLKLFF